MQWEWKNQGNTKTNSAKSWEYVRSYNKWLENKKNQSEGSTEYNEKTKPIKGGRTLHVVDRFSHIIIVVLLLCPKLENEDRDEER